MEKFLKCVFKQAILKSCFLLFERAILKINFLECIFWWNIFQEFFKNVFFLRKQFENIFFEGEISKFYFLREQFWKSIFNDFEKNVTEIFCKKETVNRKKKRKTLKKILKNWKKRKRKFWENKRIKKDFGKIIKKNWRRNLLEGEILINT